MNFDVPISTFVVCLGPSEMTEMIQTQKLKKKKQKQLCLCSSDATFL